MFEKEQITIKQATHNEARPGEHYLGAFCQELIDIMKWSTARKGSKSEEKTTSGEDQFHIFVSMEEMANAHLDPEKNHDNKFPKIIIIKQEEEHTLETTTFEGRAIV